MSTQKKQHDCCIRGRVEIKIASRKTITITRCGEWGGKHSIIVEEKTFSSTVISRTEYPESQKCIKAFEQKIRDIKKEYKNIHSF